MESGSTPSSSSSSTSSSSSSTSRSVSDKDAVLSAVKLTDSWSTDGLVMSLNYKIENPTDHSFKDFEITCNHYAPSGTKIDSNTRTVYEVVKAHGKRSARGFNMGFIHSQAARSGCKITDLVIID